MHASNPWSRRWLGAISLAHMVSCGDPYRAENPSGSGVSATASAGDGATEDAASTGFGSSDDGDDSATDAGSKFDLAAPDGPDTTGCKGIDFLFVIDNSGSMADHQAALLESVPGFVSAIEDAVGLDDFNVLVTTTEGSMLLDKCAMQCETSTTCDASAAVVECADLPFPIDPCDQAIGAGNVWTWPYVPCPITGDQRYLTQAQDDLLGAYACIAAVGTEGDGEERPMEAMVAAVTTLNEPGQCNAGFVRDAAILVVTFITDEPGDPVDGPEDDPAVWKQALVDAKHGVEEGIVILGIMADNDQPDALCGDTQAYPAPLLRQFVGLFGPQGMTHSVCASSYTSFFEQAVDLVDLTCDAYPVG